MLPGDGYTIHVKPVGQWRLLLKVQIEPDATTDFGLCCECVRGVQRGVPCDIWLLCFARVGSPTDCVDYMLCAGGIKKGVGWTDGSAKMQCGTGSSLLAGSGVLPALATIRRLDCCLLTVLTVCAGWTDGSAKMQCGTGYSLLAGSGVLPA